MLGLLLTLSSPSSLLSKTLPPPLAPFLAINEGTISSAIGAGPLGQIVHFPVLDRSSRLAKKKRFHDKVSSVFRTASPG